MVFTRRGYPPPKVWLNFPLFLEKNGKSFIGLVFYGGGGTPPHLDTLDTITHGTLDTLDTLRTLHTIDTLDVLNTLDTLDTLAGFELFEVPP